MDKYIFDSITDATQKIKAEEIGTYLLESVGHPQRIDYGSGHELSFIAFCIGLCDIRFLDPLTSCKADVANVALVVMPAYLTLVRKLQKTYKFEPAGSRGVHALDDFQFVPFIWGSAQLLNREDISPQHIPQREIASNMKSENLFFSCVDFIFQTKTGPFSEHSNTLYNISSVAGWHKINQGMLKMFKGEVLGKYPVVQHFLFGTIFLLDASQPLSAPACYTPLPHKCC